MQFKLVHADLSHSKRIWEWRNDSLTRSMFRSQAIVSWEDHSIWYQKTLEQPNKFLYVGLNGLLPVGVVRFDPLGNHQDSFEVSININPLQRGKGFASHMLKLALSIFKQEYPGVKEITAEVKKDNIASNRLFSSLDFALQPSRNIEFNHYLFAYSS